MTCTPYGINTHRLLVTGTRIPNHDECPPETGCLTDGTLTATASCSPPYGQSSSRSHATVTMKCMIDEVLFLRHGRTAYNLARRLQGQIDIPLDIVGRWQADQSAYALAKKYYWAKVAHLADHNDELAQPAYKARISPISTKSTRRRPQVDAWSSCRQTFSAPNRLPTPLPTFSDLT